MGSMMGGGKGGGRSPAAPDYASLIPAQEASNMRQYQTVLQGQRVNSQGPYGSQTWSQDPEQTNGTSNQQLSPEQQQLYNQDIGIRGGMGDIASGMLQGVQQQYSDPSQYANTKPMYDEGSRDRAEKLSMVVQLGTWTLSMSGRSSDSMSDCRQWDSIPQTKDTEQRWMMLPREGNELMQMLGKQLLSVGEEKPPRNCAVALLGETTQPPNEPPCKPA